MELHILRHGLALDRSEWLHGKDRDRPLTREGERKTRQIAAAMRVLGLQFDWILSSPYVRARDTARIVADTLRCRKCLELRDELTPLANPEKVTEVLASKQKSVESVLVVGHEPFLSRFISVLLTGHPIPRVRLKKGGLCKLEISAIRFGPCAILEWLLTPRQLNLLRD